MANLLDTDFKRNVLKMFEELKEDVEEVKKAVGKNGNISKEIENLQRSQKEILELKNNNNR